MAVTNHKTFEIVLGTQSNRKLFNGITFEGQEQIKILGPTTPTRFYGDDVISYSTKRYHTSFIGSLSFLGKSSSQENIDTPLLGITDFQNFYPIGYDIDESRKTWKLHIDPETQIFPEEVVANILGHIKTRVIDSFNLPIDSPVNCVITIPCSFGQKERQSLKDAVEIANMHLLSMTHGIVAAATNYALDLPSNDTQNLLFLSLGSQRIDAGIARMEKYKKSNSTEFHDSVKMLSCVTSEGYGGHYIDLAIANSMAEEFEKKNGINLNQEPRPLKQLLRQATKVKHVLSANKETFFSVESLYKNIDFKYKFSRTKLESILDKIEYFKKVQETIETALVRSNLTFSEINGIELLGGVWRTPHIYNQLANLTSPIPLGQHLNSDEAIAKGAAFMAANYSAGYHVKPIYVTDISSKEYKIHIENLKEENDIICSDLNSTKVLLHPNGKFYGNKKISLSSNCDIRLSLFEDNKLLSIYNITGLTKSSIKTYPNLPSPKVNINFKIDLNGIIKLTESQATFEETYTEAVEDKDVLPSSANTTETDSPTTNSVNNTSVDQFPDQNIKTDELNNTDVNSSNNTQNPTSNLEKGKDTSDTAQSTEHSSFEFSNTTGENQFQNSTENQQNDNLNLPIDQPANKTKLVEKVKKHIVKLEVSILNSFPLPLTSYQKEKAISTLRYYNERDQNASLLSFQRNELESFIYSTKPLLNSDTYKIVTSDSQLESLKALLDENENWLYNEPYANITDVNEKLSDLKNQVTTIKFMAMEYELRPKVTETMEVFLSQESQSIPQILQKKPWIDSQSIESLLIELQNVQKWWLTVKEQQNSQPLDTSPAFTHIDVAEKIKDFKIKKSLLENTPEPLPQNNTTTIPEENIDPDLSSKNETDSLFQDKINSTESADINEVNTNTTNNEIKNFTSNNDNSEFKNESNYTANNDFNSANKNKQDEL